MEPSHQAQLIHQIPKMVKVMSRRTGRLYYKPIPMEQPSFSRATLSSGSTMEHPIIIATVAAGLVGVIIVVILILTIWIRRCHSHKEEDEQDEKPQTLTSSFPSQVSELSVVVSGSESSGCSRNSTMEIFPRSSSALSFGSQGERRFKSSHILLTIPEITKSMNDIHHQVHREPENTEVV